LLVSVVTVTAGGLGPYCLFVLILAPVLRKSEALMIVEKFVFGACVKFVVLRGVERAAP
jgi:hypothetical protein